MENSTFTTMVPLLFVAAVNDPPTISYISNQSMNEDQSYKEVLFTVNDVDSSVWLDITSSDPTLFPNLESYVYHYGTQCYLPLYSAANRSGTATITITANDLYSSTSQSFLVTVSAVNDQPYISVINNQTINEDSANHEIQFSVEDPDSAVTVQITSSNQGLFPTNSINWNHQGFSYTLKVSPLSNMSGESTFTVTASDGSLSYSRSFKVTVNPVNDPPTLTLSGSTYIEMEIGDQFQEPGYQAQDLEEGTINHLVTITPLVAELTPGDHTLTYIATDAGGASSEPATRQVKILFPLSVDIDQSDTFRAKQITNLTAATNSGAVLSTETYEWHFADGSIYHGKDVTHNFFQTGLSKVTVIVTRNGIQYQRDFNLLIEQSRFSIQGTIMELELGKRMRLFANSESLTLSRPVEIVGTGANMPYIINDLPPANDYKINWLALPHPGGYRKVGPQQIASTPVGWEKAHIFDLTEQSLTNVNFSLIDGRTITVNFNNVPTGTTISAMAMSASTDNFSSLEKELQADETSIVLQGLLPVSDYKLMIETNNSEIIKGFYFQNDQLIPNVGAALLIDLSQQDASIDINLQEGRSISGQISSLPQGITVQMEAWSSLFQQGSITKVVGQGGSDPLSFSVDGLPPLQDYRLCIKSEQIRSGCYAGLELPLGSYAQAANLDLRNENIDDITLTLNTGLSLSGLVVDIPPQVNVQVEAFAPSNYYGGSEQTTLNSRQASTITVVKGLDVTDVNVNLSLSTTYTFSGNISGLDEANQFTPITLSIWNNEGYWRQSNRIGNGSIEVKNIPAGAYTLAVNANNCPTMFLNFDAEQNITWTPMFEQAQKLSVQGDVLDVAITLIQGVSLSGSVTFAGLPIAQIQISAAEQNNQVGGSTSSRADGSYFINGLLPGMYNVGASDNQGRESEQRSLPLYSSDSDVDFSLVEKAGKIQGQLISSNSNSALISLYNANDEFIGATVPDIRGGFSFISLDVGVFYSIRVNTDEDYSTFEYTQLLEVNGEETMIINLQ